MLFKLWLADDMLMSHAGSSGNSEYCVAGTWVLEKKNKAFLRISIFSEKRDQQFYFVLNFKIPLRKIASEQYWIILRWFSVHC